MVTPEPFWVWWETMMPNQIHTGDTLSVSIADRSHRTWKLGRFRGLDNFKSRAKFERGILIRTAPPSAPGRT
jgi:hypothetical protein